MQVIPRPTRTPNRNPTKPVARIRVNEDGKSTKRNQFAIGTKNAILFLSRNIMLYPVQFAIAVLLEIMVVYSSTSLLSLSTCPMFGSNDKCYSLGMRVESYQERKRHEQIEEGDLLFPRV